MSIGSQSREDRIIELVFPAREHRFGFIVDVGAADGIDNSNSYHMLKRPGWGGVLIEPEPTQYKDLEARYRGRDNVVCQNLAIGTGPPKQTLHCGMQSSTLQRKHYETHKDKHDVNYTGQVQVRVMTLTDLLVFLNVETIDFISIDAEGMNYPVWQTLDLSIFQPKLVCIEGGKFVMHGYRELCRLPGNTFYIREDLCNPL